MMGGDERESLTGSDNRNNNSKRSGGRIGRLFRRKTGADSSNIDNVDDGASSGKESVFRDSGSEGGETQPSLGAASHADEEVTSDSDNETLQDESPSQPSPAKQKYRKNPPRDLLDDGAGEQCDENEEGGDDDDGTDDDQDDDSDEESEEDGDFDKSDKEVEENDDVEYHRELVKRRQQSTDWKANFHSDQDEPDQYAEMTSLIGSGDGSSKTNTPTVKGRLGALSRLWGRKNSNNTSPDTPEGKERQGLLCGGNEEEDGDYNYTNETYRDQPSGKGLVDRNQEEYHDESDEGSLIESQREEYSDDIGGSDFSQGNQDLYQRIHGFGNSDSVLGSRYTDNPATDGRYLAQNLNHNSMSSMNIEYDGEKRGFLWGIGRKIKQRRQESDDEKNRMVAYIDELEFNLRQKEKEVQQWKQRAEELEKQLKRMRGEEENEGDDQVDGEDDDTDDDSEAEDKVTASSKHQPVAQEGDLLQLTKAEKSGRFESAGLHDDDSKESEGIFSAVEGEVATDGILIDVTEKSPVFDPLTSRTTAEEPNVEEDNLLDAAKYQQGEQSLCGTTDPGDDGAGEPEEVKDTETTVDLDQQPEENITSTETAKENLIDTKLSDMPTIVG